MFKSYNKKILIRWYMWLEIPKMWLFLTTTSTNWWKFNLSLELLNNLFTSLWREKVHLFLLKKSTSNLIFKYIFSIDGNAVLPSCFERLGKAPPPEYAYNFLWGYEIGIYSPLVDSIRYKTVLILLHIRIFVEKSRKRQIFWGKN